MTHVGSFYHELSKVSLSTSVCQFCRSDQDCERSLEDMNFGRLRANDGQLEYPQRALFHLCCLRGRSCGYYDTERDCPQRKPRQGAFGRTVIMLPLSIPTSTCI